MGAPWLDDTRTSYDTVAASYADLLRDSLAGLPHVRGSLRLFADLVLAAGGGPVADVGCGPGHVTGYLRTLGVDAFGVDLSPGMVEIARREHPGARFTVGSMTDLDLPDGSVTGVLGFYSLIHVPDEDVPAVLARFHRATRPGGVVALGFHVGDRVHVKTEGYGGHPMNVRVHLRPPERVAAWLVEAGLTVEAQLILDPAERVPGAVLYARRT
jgi:SAM-dependent methyltransferase